MPIVHVYRGRLSESSLARVCQALPEIVARAMSCNDPEGKLDPQHVRVQVHDPHYLDQNADDPTIVIEVNDYPDRMRNLWNRMFRIFNESAKHLPAGHKFSVWVRPGPGSYYDGQGLFLPEKK